MKIVIFGLFIISVISAIYVGLGQNHPQKGQLPDNEYTWWKGNLHTHTVWRDGDHFPEQVARWYKENGYHFISFTEHNTIQQGEKWVQPDYDHSLRSAGGNRVFRAYLEEFGEDWVDYRTTNDTLEVRLKTMDEYRHLFEESERFILFQGEEVTDHQRVHVNVHNIEEVIPPQGGETIKETIQNNINAVKEHQYETDQPIFAHLNHPIWNYSIAAEDLAEVKGIHFFEVFNGHGGVLIFEDDEYHITTDKFWDIVLTLRLGHLDLGIMYGLAVDDAHRYEGSITDIRSLPGRGWVKVRSKSLTQENIIKAMKAGDFYASTGIKLIDFGFENGRYWLEIEPEDGVEYTIQFIGTPVKHDISSKAVLNEYDEEIYSTRIYGDEIGQVYKEVVGTVAEYKVTGEELYIRAKIISNKQNRNLYHDGDVEVAWTQPVSLINKNVD